MWQTAFSKVSKMTKDKMAFKILFPSYIIINNHFYAINSIFTQEFNFKSQTSVF